MFVIDGKNLTSHSSVKGILNSRGLYAKKKYGQNFLVDENILKKIVEAGEITRDDLIIEIGPGLGVLTASLAKEAGKVAAVEIDRSLIPVLNDNLAEFDNAEIINADFLKINLTELIESQGYKKAKIIANLPYYITTPIIFAALESGANIESIVVMVQKEVGGRLKAKPSTKQYGALTLFIDYYADVSFVTDVPPDCFYPKPDVESAVVKLSLLKEPRVRVSDEDRLFKIIKTAFSMRRKTLTNCLLADKELNLSKNEITDIIKQAGLDENVRGEALTLGQFADITERIGALVPQHTTLV